MKEIKFCKKCDCHTERKKDGRCIPCSKVYDASWRSANHENIVAYNAAYRAANREKIKASHAAWQKANPEYIKAAVRRYAERHPEKRKASKAAWQAANRDRMLIHLQNRRAKVRSIGGKLSIGLKEKLFMLQKGKCACCKADLSKKTPHLDHRMPIALGGSNTDDNIQLLCSKCNQSKNAKHPVDFMQSRGFLL